VPIVVGFISHTARSRCWGGVATTTFTDVMLLLLRRRRQPVGNRAQGIGSRRFRRPLRPIPGSGGLIQLVLRARCSRPGLFLRSIVTLPFFAPSTR
jgi:hypothetical protein